MPIFKNFLSALFGGKKKPVEVVARPLPLPPAKPIHQDPAPSLFKPLPKAVPSQTPEPVKEMPTPIILNNDTKTVEEKPAGYDNLVKVIGSISKWSGKYATALADAMYAYKIDTPLRQIHFLAQVGHESGDFRLTEEGLSYSAAAIKKNFKSRFSNSDGTWNESLIARYTYQPEKFANFVYGDRLGNAGRPNAGWLHRGMGLMQCTGYDNQLAYSMWRYGDDRVIKDPQKYLSTIDGAVYSAIWFWVTNRLNTWADKDDLLACGRVVNRGTANTTKMPNGQPDRKRLYDLIKPQLL